jgi:hypothetical protein
MVAAIGHVKVARGVDGEASRGPECGSGAVAVRETECAGAGERGDHTRRRDHADTVVERICDENVAGAVDRHALRLVELRGCASTVGKAGGAGPREGGHYAGRCDSANNVITGVRHVDVVAGSIDRNAR